MVIGSLLHWLASGLSVCAVAAFVLALRAEPSSSLTWRRCGAVMMVGSALTMLGAIGVLEQALITRDMSIGYVGQVTEDAMPIYYRVTSLWSAMEGSLLLWVFALIIIATILTARPRMTPPVAGIVAAACVAGFAMVSLIETPFTAAGAAAGSRPSPLLQDHPAMGVHPPLLYAGFAAMLVPYALSLAALIDKGSGPQFYARVHRWMLSGWVLLGAGIGLGAWWSYSVLGWGGYWAWDPVENASLLPWLAATVALHCLAPRARGSGWRRWVMIVSGLPFVLVVLATFLTRSGVVASIHAFSLSPVGAVLGIIALAVLATWIAFVARGRRAELAVPARKSETRRPGPSTGAVVLIAGRVTLLLVIAVVLVGTLLPTLLGTLSGNEVVVGAPWYARTLAPLGIAVLVLMAAGPLLRGPTPLSASTIVAAIAAAASAIVALVLGAAAELVLTIALAAFIVVTSVSGIVRAGVTARAVGARIAHVGVALSAVVVVAGGGTSVAEHSMTTAEAVDFGQVDGVLIGLEREDRGQSSVAIARVLVSGSGEVFEARPELRYYPEHGAVVAGPEIRSEFSRDVYISLMDVDPAAETAVVRIAIIPLLPWLWWTGSLLPVGGALCLLPGSVRLPGGRPHRADRIGKQNEQAPRDATRVKGRTP